jgi:cytochrome P450
MTSVLIHLNPTIFPNPNDFIPERWVENPRLSRYLVSFSKGSRQCLGMNLAYAEIYLCLANLFYYFPDMKLYDTTKRDVEIQADNYMPKASGRGVKVMLN